MARSIVEMSRRVESGLHQFRTLRACWRKNASFLRDHLSRSTDWLTTALEDLPATALLYLRSSNPRWPLVGETVDRICLLDIIPESVLLHEQACKRQTPAAQVSFVPDEAQQQPPTAGAAAAAAAPMPLSSTPLSPSTGGRGLDGSGGGWDCEHDDMEMGEAAVAHFQAQPRRR